MAEFDPLAGRVVNTVENNIRQIAHPNNKTLRGEGMLLDRVWNYDLGMMKEYVRPQVPLPSVEERMRDCQEEGLNGSENEQPARHGKGNVENIDNGKNQVLQDKSRGKIYSPSTPGLCTPNYTEPKGDNIVRKRRLPLTPLSSKRTKETNLANKKNDLLRASYQMKARKDTEMKENQKPHGTDNNQQWTAIPHTPGLSSPRNRSPNFSPCTPLNSVLVGKRPMSSMMLTTDSSYQSHTPIQGKNDFCSLKSMKKTVPKTSYPPKGPRLQKDPVDLRPDMDYCSEDSDCFSDPDYNSDMPSVNCHHNHGRGRGYLSHSMHLRNKIPDGKDIPFRALDFGDDDIHNNHADDQDDIEYCIVAGNESDFSDAESDESDYNEEFDEQNSGDIGHNFIYDSYDILKTADRVVKEYATLGAPNVQCSHCNASMWREERVNKSCIKGTPIFSLCCAKGQIQLPKEKPTPSFLWQLHNDKVKSRRFQDGIRLYNSLFAFTSTGGKVDHSINSGGAPYVYRLNGQNHHLFGSLIPDDGKDPKFCQLYIYDTQNELENRLKWVSVVDGCPVDAEIVQGLTDMLDFTNDLVKEFRSARDRYELNGIQDVEIKLKVSRSESGRENHISPSDEVAGIMVGDLDDTEGKRDIIINSKKKGLERISDIHPKLMALQYPILFPHGCDGFHKDIPFGKVDNVKSKTREMISMMEYYSYKFQIRKNEAITPRLGGRLYQQYMVDAFSTIEQARLWWFRRNQTTLRSELYSNIKRSLHQGTSDTTNIGKSFILPAGFVGSRRYMQQNFQDALAVCRYIGHPDIFLTMTTNPLWDEILQMMKLIPQCSPQNSPDVIARVFRLKLDQLIDDIKKKNYFGTCLAVMYVVEFQKRGLPHVHMLIWLDSASKKNLTANVDKFVSAEIPDPELDPVGYEAVSAFMMHGPCGRDNPKCACMKDHKCTRHFPKRFCSATTFDQSGFPIYKRREMGFTVKKGRTLLGNQWVVPYNRDLLVKYQCHMNIEICAHARSLKYLFKYCLKGHDRATVEIRGKKRRTDNGKEIAEGEDEIQSYFDGRYICACEAAYRIFGFTIHYRSLAVERLSFHLEGNKQCTFRSSEPVHKVAQREKEKYSQLEAYFILNASDTNATKFLYDEIPQHYVWNDSDRIWVPRKRGKKIGRLAYTHHSSGELWYLRLLLTKVRGPTSYESLRTVNGKVFKTFQQACKEYGLLDDDNEWHHVLQECSQSGFPHQIRQLFVHIMVNCKVADLNELWTKHWTHMVDDLMLKQQKLTGNPHLVLNEKQQQFFALAEIHTLLKSIGKSLKDYSQMPQPPTSYLDCSVNNLIIEETSYDTNQMEADFNELFSTCNEEQLHVYNSVMESVQKKEGGVFFVYGSGGCGKTYMWRTLISKLRAERKIVLPVASSGIAATLMPGGRTAHSRFKIPIVLDELSMCSISHTSDIAELIKRTDLIIWDEAPMQHRFSFECLDRSLRDIMKAVDPQRFDLPFGGITIVFGGDFRQILPVIPRAGRGEIVSSAITNSKIWKIATVFKLKHNMRLQKGKNEEEVRALTEFASWVLAVGDGKIPTADIVGEIKGEDLIVIPEKFCQLDGVNSVDKMVESTFPDFLTNYRNPDYLSERAILSPTNVIVGNVNSVIVDKIPGDCTSYFSVDSAEDFPGSEREQLGAFPPEYLHSFNIPGMPLHELKLKVGVVVMLMRNLNQTLGLCNGTRMMVTKCLKHCVECEVISGQYKGTKHFIPRMELSPTETRLPFRIIRKQMPLQICYAMTINKSQGQSLEKVGLFLPKGVFTHGQLYVAISRVTSPDGLKIFIDDMNGNSTNITPNVVYKEIFYNVPVI